MTANRKTRREARALFRLCRVDGLLDENRVRQVVQLVLASQRRHSGGILSEFRRLVRLDCIDHTATIESAIPLPMEMRVAIKQNLAQVYGPGLSSEFTRRAALIAGVRIRVGSDVYDGTVMGRLAALEGSL